MEVPPDPFLDCAVRGRDHPDLRCRRSLLIGMILHKPPPDLLCSGSCLATLVPANDKTVHRGRLMERPLVPHFIIIRHIVLARVIKDIVGKTTGIIDNLKNLRVCEQRC